MARKAHYLNDLDVTDAQLDELTKSAPPRPKPQQTLAAVQLAKALSGGGKRAMIAEFLGKTVIKKSWGYPADGQSSNFFKA
ncbi:hypothetical protein FEM03_07350 [Phragmitibacter flavus]|uniref:Uncharacterized protein n=1 Tax=Phragmitibacter flavus TaxID=2576071 RepID=A0A5R8KI93_9BACT|nr:hypothetical protein [Phragmitibacter flavus]TLD71339.1 hypothetical protein FEM03_07350 [Phragmitibacter flavus]